MNLILCHTTADFDTLGAAVGLTRLQPGARIVLAGGSHPTVKEFLALHRDEYPLIERRSVSSERVRRITVVDTQWRDRLGKAAEWLDLPAVEVEVYDHHLATAGDINPHHRVVEAVGATTTLVVERLQQEAVQLTVSEATVMALGIHVDTGSLTYDHATARDAAALTWLMQQGASLRAIAEYLEPSLSPQLQDLLAAALDQITTETFEGYTLSWVLLDADTFIPGLSSLAAQLMTLTETDLLLLAVRYPASTLQEERMTIIGRARSGSGASPIEGIHLGELFHELGGGGHARAASIALRQPDPEGVLKQLLGQLRQKIPKPPLARELMSSPVRTIRPETTIAEAQRILLRYGHSGLSVVDEQDRLVGVISRRDLDIALHHGFSHAPVKGYMTTMLKTIAPDTTLPEIEALMVTYDIGRLPVLQDGQLLGIVTRTDVLRQLHQAQTIGNGRRTVGDGRAVQCPLPQAVLRMLRDRLKASLWEVLTQAAAQAEQRGWQLYVVGGAVRDLLLANRDQALMIEDVDLVVDGFHQAADQAAGVELARALQQHYPDARLQIHGRFQTAALLWHNDPQLDSLWIDIATARTEFYPYPAANPEVEASSIRQDLYRRDFTINALAIRLTAPRSGELLDFFGGLVDLQDQTIRVLHANSFIEDPTRIYRAVRFAVRLGFQIDPQTVSYIHHAIASGIYHRIQAEMDKTPALQTRLRRELKYILEAAYWRSAIRLLDELGALRCLHPDLELSPVLEWRMRLVDRWLQRLDRQPDRQFDRQRTIESWQLLLEVLLAHLDAGRVQVAEGLQLPVESVERLRQIDGACREVQAALPRCDRPSQIVQLLGQYDLPMLTLLAVYSPRPIRKRIWQYLTCWADVKPPLSGNDLKALGYKPGKQFKPMLEALRAAQLDGEIRDRADAEAFLAKHFPRGH